VLNTRAENMVKIVVFMILLFLIFWLSICCVLYFLNTPIRRRQIRYVTAVLPLICVWGVIVGKAGLEVGEKVGLWVVEISIIA